MKPFIYQAHNGRWQSALVGQTPGGPPTPLPVPAMGWQTNLSPGTADFAQSITDMGQAPMIRRIYETWPSSWATSGAAENTDTYGIPWTVMSLQPPGMASTGTGLSPFARGDFDSQLGAFLNSKPSGHHLTTTVWHEPENQIFVNHNFTLKDWKDANTHLANFVKALNDPHQDSTVIYMAFDFYQSGIAKWGLQPSGWWDPGFVNLTYLGFDTYFDISGNGNGPATLSAAMGPTESFAGSHNKPLLMPEFAVNEILTNGTTGTPKVITDPRWGQTTDKAVFEESVYARAIQRNWAGIIYFDVTGVHYNTDHTYLMRSSVYAQNRYSDIVTRAKAGSA